MVTFVKMPKLGLTMAEGTIIKWLKGEGENISKGEPLVVVESDKSTVDYEAPESGVLRKILIEQGETVPILTDIAIIADSMDEEIPDTQDTGVVKANDDEIDEPEIEAEKNNDGGEVEVPAAGERIFASPAARRIARENNIDLGLVTKKPEKKRIEKIDVLDYLEQNRRKMTPLASKIAANEGIDISTIDKKPGERIYSSDLIGRAAKGIEKTVPVTGMRKVIARRMKESLEIGAQVSITTEVNMTNAINLKDNIKDKINDYYGSKISINDIILKFVSRALRENPRINSEFTQEEIILKEEINIGLAVALDEGLIVPVIKNVDSKGLGEIAKESRDLINRARNGNLLPDEYAGGTFTVSNLGMFDITEFNSIINQPESAILSVGKIVDRPVVVGENIEINPIMKLTLTFDHRPIDGAAAAIFLKRVKDLLEEPYEMMI